MFKKLCIAAAAAGAISVPLAGAAWADPADPSSNDPSSNGNGIGQGGVPQKAGAWSDAISAANPNLPSVNPNGSGPLAPGQFFSDLAKMPGNAPKAGADAANFIYGYYTIPDVSDTPNQTNFEFLPPGLSTKEFTPACSTGHTASDPAVNGGDPACH